jgi:hypothetical protein
MLLRLCLTLMVLIHVIAGLDRILRRREVNDGGIRLTTANEETENDDGQKNTLHVYSLWVMLPVGFEPTSLTYRASILSTKL